MANSVSFVDFSESDTGLSKTEVKDLIDVLFRPGDGIFTIYGAMRKGEKKGTRGLCVYNAFFDTVDIYLAPDSIMHSFNRGVASGGNQKNKSYRAAMGAVLAHELQHANQYRVHKGSHSSFFGKVKSKYRARASEREARNFADENADIIAKVLQLKTKTIKDVPDTDSVEDVAASLVDAGTVSIQDIVDELKLSRINNSANVKLVREILKKKKVKVVHLDGTVVE